MTAILLDIDGVLLVSGEAINGATEAVRRLRADGHRLRFVTNNTTQSRQMLADDLRKLGFELDDRDRGISAVRRDGDRGHRRGNARAGRSGAG